MKRLLPFVLVVLVLVACAPARGDTTPAPKPLQVSALPQIVDRYDTYVLSVTGTANASILVDIFGPNSFHVAFENHTDTYGVSRTTLQAYYDFGQYSVQVRSGNQSALAELTVQCDARCTSDILSQNGQQQLQAVIAIAQQYGLYVLIVVCLAEILRLTVTLSRAAKDAKQHGRYSPGGILAAPFASLRGHINPGDNVADPRNVQNPRIAVDLERRQLMEQLHAATSRPYLEWRPGHVQNLEDIWRDLKSAWSRQLSIQPEGVPYGADYVRPIRPKLSVTGGSGMSDQEMDTYAKQLKGEQDGRTKNPLRWAAYVAGALGLVMALLVIGAYFGFYVPPLAALWTPWPPDSVKVGLGVVLVVVAVAVFLKQRTVHHVRA